MPVTSMHYAVVKFSGAPYACRILMGFVGSEDPGCAVSRLAVYACIKAGAVGDGLLCKKSCANPV